MQKPPQVSGGDSQAPAGTGEAPGLVRQLRLMAASVAAAPAPPDVMHPPSSSPLWVESLLLGHLATARLCWLLLLLMTGQSPPLNQPCFLLQRTGSGSSLPFPRSHPQEFAPRNWAGGHPISAMTSLGPGYHWTGTPGLAASSASLMPSLPSAHNPIISISVSYTHRQHPNGGSGGAGAQSTPPVMTPALQGTYETLGNIPSGQRQR